MTIDQIPLLSLSRQISLQRDDIEQAISRVLDSGQVILGAEVAAFESEFASYIGLEHCVAVANGTDALMLAMLSLGLTEGDIVITTGNAGGYTSAAARAIGVRVLYVDVNPDTLQMSGEALLAALEGNEPIRPKIKALVVTHLFGAMAEIIELSGIAHEYGLKIIEDCAQSAGSRFGNRHSGTFGDVSTFSFYPTKNLGALGDAGAVATRSEVISNRLKKLRQYGWKSKYEIEIPKGLNSRMDEIQAAVLLVKLNHLEALNGRRREIHRRYEAVNTRAGRIVNISSESYNGHLAILDTPVGSRDRVIDWFRLRGITTDIHYPIPDHQQTGLRGELALGTLSVTEAKSKTILTLPLDPLMSEHEIERVSRALEDYR